ncbi:MAG: hypothetical protein LBG97_01360 [Coriobacteriales bacterium]|nr:hypothetical protein [Coriobacteriales bacterium]
MKATRTTMNENVEVSDAALSYDHRIINLGLHAPKQEILVKITAGLLVKHPQENYQRASIASTSKTGMAQLV